MQEIVAEIDAIPNITIEQDRDMFGRMSGLQGEQMGVLDEIERLAARTPEGLRAKAVVLETKLRDQRDPDGSFADGRDGIAWSLVQDVLGRPA